MLHLLYVRFWHKVLFDHGICGTPEPFGRLFNQGMILADAFTDARGMYVPATEVSRQGDGWAFGGEPVSRRSGKMGKSLKNGVSPDEIHAAYGADTLRLYEMAMGPLEVDRPWHTDDIVGMHRFLQRVWRLVIDESSGEPVVGDDLLDPATARLLHQSIAVVRDDFAALRFNTAIARLIELTAHASRLPRMPRALAEPMILMLAPLAPHLAEELWQRLGHESSLAYEPFPRADPVLAEARTVTLPVQVNGKVRFTIDVPAAATEADIQQVLAGHPGYPGGRRGPPGHRARQDRQRGPALTQNRVGGPAGTGSGSGLTPGTRARTSSWNRRASSSASALSGVWMKTVGERPSPSQPATTSAHGCHPAAVRAASSRPM